MFKSYLKTALRNLWRNKVYSLINLLGLAVGMAACLLIFLYVSFELSYDAYHDKESRIYRVVTDVITPTETINASITSGPMAPNIKADFPEVEEITRVYYSSFILQKDNQKFEENEVLFADTSFFTVFSFPLIKGDPHRAFAAPFSVVLSETAARKYFGSGDPMGQSLLLDGKYNAMVTGVMKDIPVNSHFRSDVFVSMVTKLELSPYLKVKWDNFGFYTYVLLHEGSDPNRLQAKFPEFMKKHAGDLMKQNNMYYTLFLEPLKRIYLHSKRISGPLVNTTSGNISNIYIFSIVAVFILLIACINFINLTTARAAERAKEVGIRKVIGAARKQLALQFLGESILLCLVAFVFAILISSLTLPVFNELSGKIISRNIFGHGWYLMMLLAVTCFIGLIAGIYPASVLSGFKPIAVLKGRFSSGKKGLVLRKTLVVIQFSISIILIAATMVVYAQLNYMRSRQLGFKKDQMLVIDFKQDDFVQKNYQVFKQEFTGIPNVLSVSVSSTIPGQANDMWFTHIENRSGEMQGGNLDVCSVDYDFLQQYNIKIIAGRPFLHEMSTDSTKALIINEAAAKSFGYPSALEAVGKRFEQGGNEGRIIGVARDFHFNSLQEAIKPLTLRIGPGYSGVISLNVASQDLPATIAAIGKTWNRLIPRRPFSYFFVDQAFDRLYRAEEQFGKLFLYFAALAILISCLGLLGLTAYSTIQRTKEIGIRKVLGATVSGIINLLSREFLKLVLISSLLGFPIAWWAMSKWLKDFAYRINISWWVFVVATAIALLIALLTISYQAIKAAVANPVKSLRTE